MGRDFYDAMFLMGKTKPNQRYLKERLNISDIRDVKERLERKCKNVELKALMRDIEPFLFMPEDAKKILLFEESVFRME